MADAVRNFARLSAAAYLQMERQATHKHVFVNGVVYAMAGAGKRHAAIAGNVFAFLHPRLSAPCQLFSSDVKVHVRPAPNECYYHPDVSVSCSDLDTDPNLVKLPSLIVEVLSRSADDSDRGYKFDDYRTLASLREYVLVHQNVPRVEVYRRQTNWEKEIVEPDAAITLEGVGVTLPFNVFYLRVGFPPGPGEEV